MDPVPSLAQGQISNIEAFMDQCPQNDAAFPIILADFEIRNGSNIITQFPCTEPVSQMPLEEYTNELILMQGLRAIYHMQDAALPWTNLSLYDWLKSKVQGIQFAPSSSCCYVIGSKTFMRVTFQNDFNREFDRKWEGLSGNISLYFHEARHADNFPHKACCDNSGSCDQTYDENKLSANGIQWWLNSAWLDGRIDVGYGCLSSTRVRQISNWHFNSCNGAFRDNFCDTQPPLVEMPATPGTLTGCESCSLDTDCSDQLFCNGQEVCINGICQGGIMLNCSDNIGCTLDTCIEPGTCSHSPSNLMCNDGQVCTSDICSTSGCVNQPMQPCCGDNICDPEENCENCWTDCFGEISTFCGDGVCQPGETCSNCNDDCRGTKKGKQKMCCSGQDCANSLCSQDGWECDPTARQPCCNLKGFDCVIDRECCSNKCRGGSCK